MNLAALGRKTVLIGNRILNGFGELLQALILLVFRLHWGWAFFATGKGKLLNHADIVEYFTALSIPFPGFSAWLVGAVECFGGLLLIIGLFSRPVALVLAITMSVAYLSVPYDREKFLNILHDPEPFLTAEPFFFLLTALLVFAFGPGRLSFDALIARILAKPEKNVGF